NFYLASDGSGGTIVADPPADSSLVPVNSPDAGEIITTADQSVTALQTLLTDTHTGSGSIVSADAQSLHALLSDIQDVLKQHETALSGALQPLDATLGETLHDLPAVNDLTQNAGAGEQMLASVQGLQDHVTLVDHPEFNRDFNGDLSLTIDTNGT